MVVLEKAIPSVVIAKFGNEAIEAIGDVISRVRASDPMAPITVITSTALASLSLRRTLSTQGDGVANIKFTTVNQLVKEINITNSSIEKKQRLNQTLIRSLVRDQVQENSKYASALRHDLSLEVVSRAVTQLLKFSDSDLENLSVKSKIQIKELIRIRNNVQALLANEYELPNETTIYAANILSTNSQLQGQLGHIIFYLPQVLSTLENSITKVVQKYLNTTVILGTTGNKLANYVCISISEQFLIDNDISLGTEAKPEIKQFLSAPNADTEAHYITRLVTDALAQSSRPSDIGIIVPNSSYLRLFSEYFYNSQIPFYGQSYLKLEDTIAGKFVAKILTFILGSRISHVDLTGLVRSVPLLTTSDSGMREQVDEVEMVECIETFCAEANLSTWIKSLESQIEYESKASIESKNYRVLLELMKDLEALGSHSIKTCADFRDRLIVLVKKWLGEPDDLDTWSPIDRQAFRDLLSELLLLDQVDKASKLISHDEAKRKSGGSEIPLERIVQEITLILRNGAATTARFGEGVYLGKLKQAYGMDFDHLFVAGLNEGQFPQLFNEDPIMPDSVKEEMGFDVLSRRRQNETELFAFHGILTSSKHSTLSTIRGDQLQGRELRPSPWFVDLLKQSASKEKLFVSELKDLEYEKFYRIPSFTLSIRSCLPPANLEDFDMRAIGKFQNKLDLAEFAKLTNSSNPRLSRSLGYISGRANFKFDESKGKVNPNELLLSSSFSATSLEKFAKCPRLYFFNHVLSIWKQDDIEEGLSAKKKGILIHAILQNYIDYEIKNYPEFDGLDQWSLEDREEYIASLAESEINHTFGKVGYFAPRNWYLGDLTLMLKRFVKADLEQRVTGEGEIYRPRAIEEKIKLKVKLNRSLSSTLEVEEIEVNGKVDRTDISNAGHVRVFDYKTGVATTPGREIANSNPVKAYSLGGRFLQLPIYAQSYIESTGAPEVSAYYWYLKEDSLPTEEVKAKPFRANAATRENLDAFIGELASVIVNGIFPATPSSSSFNNGNKSPCENCDFRTVCPADKNVEWQKIKGHDSLVELSSLIQGEVNLSE
ncbi:MAG: hypothetical protein HKL80_11265 [Acidimicrobiales bacterium]|nr:hypothetical protein [Acidimicrobiales bacterium]